MQRPRGRGNRRVGAGRRASALSARGALSLWARILRAEDRGGPARRVVGAGRRPRLLFLPTPPWPPAAWVSLELFPRTQAQGRPGLALLSAFLSSGSWCQGPCFSPLLLWMLLPWVPGPQLQLLTQGWMCLSPGLPAHPGHGLPRPSPWCSMAPVDSGSTLWAGAPASAGRAGSCRNGLNMETC